MIAFKLKSQVFDHCHLEIMSIIARDALHLSCSNALLSVDAVKLRLGEDENCIFM